MKTDSAPKFEALWPLSRKAVEVTDSAARLPSLEGKTIAELWDVAFRGEIIFPMVRKHILERFPGAKIVDYGKLGNFYGPRGAQVLENLPDVLREYRVDAAIVGIGA